MKLNFKIWQKRVSILLSLAFTFSLVVGTANTVRAEYYHPQMETWIDTADSILKALDEGDTDAKECSKTAWTSFSKSFQSYGNFAGDWGDLFRNDCLREDIWALEDKLQELNRKGVEQALQCNTELEELKTAYSQISGHIQGLRTYGEKQQIEESDSVNCPVCNKAEIVGAENVDYIYYNAVYTADKCELTQEESADWKAEWEKLTQNMNFFKNIKNIWADAKSETGHSWGFTDEDYAAAQKNADSWWGNTWESFYGYNGRQLSFRHLREGEDSLFSSTRLKTLGKNAGQAVANLLPPPTVAELTEKYDTHLDVYYSLSAGKEDLEEGIDLLTWKSELSSKYTVNSEVRLDLENYLIQLNNSIKKATEPIEPYRNLLHYTASNHCRNLYGACTD